MKKVSTAILFQRALEAGLPRAAAHVIAVIGYWDQIEGGTKRRGRLWKWRNYDEIAQEVGYAPVTIQRAVKYLKAAGLILTRRMYNPVRSGQTVNGFRISIQGYELLGLDGPEDAEDCSQPIILKLGGPPECAVRNDQDDRSLEQINSIELQRTNNACDFGKDSEATMSAPSPPTAETEDEDWPEEKVILQIGSGPDDDW